MCVGFVVTRLLSWALYSGGGHPFPVSAFSGDVFVLFLCSRVVSFGKSHLGGPHLLLVALLLWSWVPGYTLGDPRFWVYFHFSGLVPSGCFGLFIPLTRCGLYSGLRVLGRVPHCGFWLTIVPSSGWMATTRVTLGWSLC